jgi:hypothetical protein
MNGRTFLRRIPNPSHPLPEKKMNAKKIVTMVLVLLFVAVVGSTVAQTTYYVNNQTGDDANPGTQALPRKSVTGALVSAPSGSTISVAYTGVNYIEPSIVISGRTYTFTSTGGAPVFVNAAFTVGNAGAALAITGISAANPAVVTATGHGLVTGDVVYIYGSGDAGIDNKYWTVTVLDVNTFSIPYNNAVADGAASFRTKGAVTFTGPFQFTPGLNLINGTIDGGSNVTVGGTVYRTELGSVQTGQLLYTGTVFFNYDDIITGNSTITTGLEFPVTATVAGRLGTLSTSGAVLTLKLDQNRTVGNGNNLVSTAAGNLVDLGGQTLTVVGNNGGHTFGGAVSNGTLTFNMTGGNATVAGAVALPNVIATSTDGTAAARRVLALAATSVSSLTAQSNSDIVANAVATVNASGNTSNVVTNSSNGVITMNAVTTIYGNVVLNATGVTGVGGIAQIVFGAAAALTVNGGVTNSAGIVLSDAAISNDGVIIFPDAAGATVTITGSVLESGALSGNATAATNYTANGEIRFSGSVNDQAVTINGSVTNSATSTASSAALGVAVSSNMRILFGNVASTVRADGGFVNSSAIGPVNVTAYATPNVSNGTIVFTARAAGQVGLSGNRVGTVTNTSVSTVASNGLIDFGAAATGTFWGTTVTQGAAGVGGNISFGNHVLNLSGSIVNNRTAAAAGQCQIVVPAGAATVTHAISGSVQNNSPATISIDLTGNDAIGITGGLQSTVSGGLIEFPNAGTGAISAGSVSISNGTITVPATHAANVTIAGSFTVSGGTINLLAAGAPQTISCKNINWTAGAINFGARGSIFASGAVNQIGAATTSPTFGSAATTLEFQQPLPNVTQLITIGTADPLYPGPLRMNNTSFLPPPYVVFQSLGGATTNANFYVTNNVTFESSAQPGIVNVVLLDNVRLNVGKNGAGGGSGNFQNTSGYVTATTGRVIMSGNNTAPQPQQVNLAAAPDVGAAFGDFGVDNQGAVDGVADVRFNAVCTFVGGFYFAKGEVDPDQVVPGGVTFNNSTTFPTIYRTEGIFIVNAPTFGSKVNVVYYGADKATSLEIPASTTLLNNLTVSTTNGAKPGYGVISLNASTTVNGVLTIDANQALYTGGNILTLNGTGVVVNGYLVDNGNVVPRVQLAKATGITFTGTGFLPSLQVNNGSLGNTLTGYTGLYNQGLGTDGIWAGAADDFTNADGNIMFEAGADAGSSLSVGFTGAGPHFGGLTMNSANETFTLTQNAVMSLSITQTGGIIDLGGFTLTHQGTLFSTDGTPANGSQIQNGTLVFVTNGTTLTVNSAVDTIKANVTFNSPGNTITLPASPASFPLVITGNVVLSDNSGGTAGTTVDIGNSNTLTLGGASVTVSANSRFTATTGGTTGILDLTNSPPNTLLTFTVPASASVANLTIDGNVTLAGGIIGSTLTVTNFVHNSGLFTFGTANLQIGNATAATFTRNGGTYAGDGWLIWNSTTAAGFKHSAVTAAGAMTINNFRLNQPLTLQNAVNLNIVKSLYLFGGSLTNQVGGTGGGYVVMGDASNVPMIRVFVPNDVAANALQFTNANADFTFNGPTGATVSVRVWPASATLARDVVVDMDDDANTLILAADRTVTRSLKLVEGVLTWDSPTVISMGTGAMITRYAAGALNKNQNGDATLGTFTAPNVNLVYIGDVGNSGIEYSDPVVVNNLTLGATDVPSFVTLNTARTVAGTVTIIDDDSELELAQNTTFSAAQNITTGLIEVLDDKTLTLSAACTLNNVEGNVVANAAFTLNGFHEDGTITASSNVTVGPNGSFDATSNLVFIGTTNVTLTVPADGTDAGNVTLNKTGNAPVPVVTLVGGDLTIVAPAQINLMNGLFVTGDNTLILPTVVQGFARTVATGNASHVVGNVSKAPGNGFVGRLEYPLGTLPGTGTPARYRPLAITFLLTDPLLQGGAITFTHVDSVPGGLVGLRDNGGKGIDAGLDANGRRIWLNSTPSFYWLGFSQYGLGPSQTFDLELTGEGFTSHSDTSLVAINRLRIIRRFDGNTDNRWILQGGTNYENFLFSPEGSPLVTWPIVRVKGSSGGIEPQASRFTYGYDGLGITGVPGEPAAIPTVYNLSQNYPNPFNPSTLINFDLPKQSAVTLEIYDVLGQKVKTLVNGETMDPGYYKVTWNGTNQYGSPVSSGIYFYRIVADKFTSLKKMMFLK